MLELEVDDPSRDAYAALGRPHAHAYTILAVACAETADGVRLAVSGAGPRARRLRSVEAAVASGSDPAAAAAHALADLQPQDDALASAWYRSRMLPILVQRALDQL